MKRLAWCLLVFMSFGSGFVLAQEHEGEGPDHTNAEPDRPVPSETGAPAYGPAYGPAGPPPPERDPMMRSTGDIVLDYQGLIQKIDEMRRHEDEVLRRLENLLKDYEARLKNLEETQEKLEKELKEFKKWHDEAVEKMKEADRGAAQPQEIKGEIRGAPSDRYTTN